MDEGELKRRTKVFGLRVFKLVAALPKNVQGRAIGNQLVRCGSSVGANYREAYRARSKPEFISKCGDSLRELEETACWLELLVEANCVTAGKLSNLRQECDELIAIFVIILKRSKEDPS